MIGEERKELLDGQYGTDKTCVEGVDKITGRQQCEGSLGVSGTARKDDDACKCHVPKR